MNGGYPSKQGDALGRPRGHSHRWHIFDVKSAFLPIDIDGNEFEEGKTLYERVEFAYGVCICGEVIKSKIQDNPNGIEEAIINGRDTEG